MPSNITSQAFSQCSQYSFTSQQTACELGKKLYHKDYIKYHQTQTQKRFLLLIQSFKKHIYIHENVGYPNL